MNEKLRSRMKHLFFISLLLGMAFIVFLQHRRKSGIEESFFFPYSKTLHKTEYYDNGKIKSMGTFRGKQKDGDWYYWDTSGNKTKLEIYEYGDLKEVKMLDDGKK
ncbi:MAG: hypothetical protein WD048_08280 [Chitinophagales bacterium]